MNPLGVKNERFAVIWTQIFESEPKYQHNMTPIMMIKAVIPLNSSPSKRLDAANSPAAGKRQQQRREELRPQSNLASTKFAGV